MNTFTRFAMLCCAAVLTSGCLFSNDDVSKSEARRKVATGSDVDYCGLYEWYGDGVCDDFCHEPDPDCGGTCDAAPSCGEDEVLVQSCTGFDVCEAREVCDTTYYCAVETEDCEAFPSCPPGYDEVFACDLTATCEEVTLCGTTIVCQEDACLDEPRCPEGTTLVPQCAPDATCDEAEFCGETVLCQHPTCEEDPVCPDGYAPVDSCVGADDPCTEFALCGKIIACQRPSNCPNPPTCQDGYSNAGSACPASSSCYVESGCGIQIACLLDGEECLARAQCPDGWRPTTECPQDAGCLDITVCGQTLHCTDV